MTEGRCVAVWLTPDCARGLFRDGHRVRHSGNVLRYDLLEGHTTVPRVLVPLSAMLCVFSIAWLIVGNVWVFSATTCADTSAKQMHNVSCSAYVSL